MQRRLILLALILATILQGPAFAYAATLGSSSIADAITHSCGGQVQAEGSDCDACCSHGLMTSCSVQCPAPTTAAVPLMLPTSLRIDILGVLIPDPGIAAFADHDPRNPLRPPIA
jgi:hypothetical protein